MAISHAVSTKRMRKILLLLKIIGILMSNPSIPKSINSRTVFDAI